MHGCITNKVLKLLPKTMINYINHVNEVCYRKGIGLRLIKGYLCFHIPKYYDFGVIQRTGIAHTLNQVTILKSKVHLKTFSVARVV